MMMMMDNYVGAKLKRKDLEEVNDDYSDFSLSSPARKIRRLDVELPSIIEGQDVEIPLGYNHCVPSNGVEGQWKALDIDELPFVPEHNEKAIVPFTPTNGLLFNSTSMFTVDPNLIRCFKNQPLLGAHLNTTRHSDEDEYKRIGDYVGVNACRAVVPWVPSPHRDQMVTGVSSQAEVLEPMDDEEMQEATIEIEGDDASNTRQQGNEYIRHPTVMNESLTLQQHQWLQQHCMTPQPPQNLTTPIVWYR